MAIGLTPGTSVRIHTKYGESRDAIIVNGVTIDGPSSGKRFISRGERGIEYLDISYQEMHRQISTIFYQGSNKWAPFPPESKNPLERQRNADLLKHYQNLLK